MFHRLAYLNHPTSTWKPIVSLYFRTARTTFAHARTLPSTGFKIIPADKMLEEETLPGFNAQKYYPMRLGEVFQSQYQAVAKLRYGGGSAVWLCRHLEYLVPPWSIGLGSRDCAKVFASTILDSGWPTAHQGLFRDRENALS